MDDSRSYRARANSTRRAARSVNLATVHIEISNSTKQLFITLLDDPTCQDVSRDNALLAARDSIERLCGRVNPVSGTLSQPLGFKNAELAARDLYYILGSLSKCAGMKETGYKGFNTFLTRRLGELHKQESPLVTKENIIAAAQNIEDAFFAATGGGPDYIVHAGETYRQNHGYVK